MKNIYEEANRFETPAEDGERMNRMEQEKYYRRFSERAEAAEPQKITHSGGAKRILATAACAVAVLGLAGGAGIGITELVRSTPHDTVTPASTDVAVTTTETQQAEPIAEAVRTDITLESYTRDAIGICQFNFRAHNSDGSPVAEETVKAIENDMGESKHYTSLAVQNIFDEATGDYLVQVDCQIGMYVEQIMLTNPLDGSVYAFDNLPVTDPMFYCWPNDEVSLTKNGIRYLQMRGNYDDYFPLDVYTKNWLKENAENPSTATMLTAIFNTENWLKENAENPEQAFAAMRLKDGSEIPLAMISFGGAAYDKPMDELGADDKSYSILQLCPLTNDTNANAPYILPIDDIEAIIFDEEEHIVYNITDAIYTSCPTHRDVSENFELLSERMDCNSLVEYKYLVHGLTEEEFELEQYSVLPANLNVFASVYSVNANGDIEYEIFGRMENASPDTPVVGSLYILDVDIYGEGGDRAATMSSPLVSDFGLLFPDTSPIADWWTNVYSPSDSIVRSSTDPLGYLIFADGSKVPFDANSAGTPMPPHFGYLRFCNHDEDHTPLSMSEVNSTELTALQLNCGNGEYKEWPVLDTDPDTDGLAFTTAAETVAATTVTTTALP
ncbi:MAG: hypothetical protein MJ062_00710 [Oscillospiraceae bacterium]|nr:hypothetical protein [Oscillospiraceae bacterium]